MQKMNRRLLTRCSEISCLLPLTCGHPWGSGRRKEPSDLARLIETVCPGGQGAATAPCSCTFLTFANILVNILFSQQAVTTHPIYRWGYGMPEAWGLIRSRIMMRSQASQFSNQEHTHSHSYTASCPLGRNHRRKQVINLPPRITCWRTRLDHAWWHGESLPH